MEFRFSFDLSPAPLLSLFQYTEDMKDHIDYSITVVREQSAEYVSRLRVKCNQSEIQCDLKPHANGQYNILVNKTPINVAENAKEDWYEPFFMRERRASRLFGFTLPSINQLEREIRERYETLKNALFEEDSGFFGEFEEIGNFLSMRKPSDYVGADNAMSVIAFLCGVLQPDLSAETYHDLTPEQQRLFRETQTPERQSLDQNILQLLYFYERFLDIETYLNRYFRQIHYIAPIRATAERYYRFLGLAIDEVDYQGKNLPQFLNSLEKDRMEAFQKWTEELFGFSVQLKAIEGHLSVKLRTHTRNGNYNLSDTGFGYSQLLPIIVQLWDLSTRDSSDELPSDSDNIPLTVLVEQPELHLHPALQARLVLGFLGAIELAKQHNKQLQLILETHSETILNCFGRAAYKGLISLDDISVVFFHKEFADSATKVQCTGFDEQGYLKEYPIGFFAPDDWLEQWSKRRTEES